MSDYNIHISNKIKHIREKYNISQERFGLKLGVSGKTISAYETGRCMPPLKILEKISRVYDESFVQMKDTKKERLKEKLMNIKDSLVEIEDLLNKSVTF